MNLGGEIFGLDIVTLLHKDPAFDYRFQLAHIAWPAEVHEDFQRRSGNPKQPVTVSRVVFSDEEIGQCGDIAPSFPEWWQIQPYYIQPVIEVVPEISFFDFRFKVPVRGGN